MIVFSFHHHTRRTHVRSLIAALVVFVLATAGALSAAEPVRSFATERKSASSVAGADQFRVSGGLIVPSTKKRGDRTLPPNELASKRGVRTLPEAEAPGKRDSEKDILTFGKITFRDFDTFGFTKPGATRMRGATDAPGATRAPREE